MHDSAHTRWPTPRRTRHLRFSLPLFEHIERQRGISSAPSDTNGHAVVHAHVERVLVELIADELRRVGPRNRESGPDVPGKLLARHVASTFILVLNWWVESEESLPATRQTSCFERWYIPPFRSCSTERPRSASPREPVTDLASAYPPAVRLSRSTDPLECRAGRGAPESAPPRGGACPRRTRRHAPSRPSHRTAPRGSCRAARA